MSVAQFVAKKTKQLVFYLRAFWRNELPYSEVNLFFWDTFEEWISIKQRHKIIISDNERVFWHLMHQIHFWSENRLKNDRVLKEEIKRCVFFLEHGGFCPFDCVGIRP